MNTPVQPAFQARPLFSTRGLTAALVHYRPHLAQAAHTHGYHQVSFLLCGELQEIGEGSRRCQEVLHPSVGIKPSGFSHANAYGPRGALLLALSLETPDVDGVDLTEGGWRAMDPARFGRALIDTVRVLLESRGRDPLGGLVDLLALTQLASLADGSPGPPPGWLRRARAALREDPSLSMAAVAQDCGVHPVHLSRTFTHHVGCTPTLYRAHCRLAAALELLLAGTTPCDAAQAAGFADQSHLHRTMRRFTGCTPGQIQGLFLSRG